MRAALVIVVVLLGLVALFALQNPGIITVRFLHLSGDTSLPVVVILAFGAGILAGYLGGMPSALQRRRRIRALEEKIAGGKPPAPPVAP